MFLYHFQRTFQKRLSLRKTQQLQEDFELGDGIGKDEDVPTFQKKISALAANKKADVLDDELF